MQEREAGQGGVDLAALKALAEKATKGKRTTNFIGFGYDYWAIERDDDKPDSGVGSCYAEADAHLAAACDPDTILAMIAEVEAARERRCETCAEWVDSAQNNGLEGWKVCERICQAEAESDGERAALDLSDYYAKDSFVTTPDFGCNQWRKRG